jgi:glycerophosphoryl diester phosphodiesterase
MQFAPPLGRLAWLAARPIAHRGRHDRARGVIENTASAFAAAIAGNYAIECDLQLTRDGEAVVFHDDRLDRLAEAEGPVYERTAAEIAALALRQSGDRVQTLSQLLHQVGGRVPLVIEIKSRWNGNPALVLRAIEVLSSYGGKFAVMSFDPDMVASLKELSPAMSRGIVADRGDDPDYRALPLARQYEIRSMSHLKRCDPDFISFYFRELPFAPVTAFRQAGRPVISWTIRSQEEAHEALRHSDQITFESFAA